MSYNELRRDYLLDRWVVIATERKRRPTDFARKVSEKAGTGICPFCPGNEHMTPPAVLVYLESEGEIEKVKDEDNYRHKDWIIRCFSNLFPAFTPPKKETEAIKGEFSGPFAAAIGHHEVIVESPVHDEHPSDAGIPQLIHVVNAYLDRLRELSSKHYVRYVSIFRNHGVEAGASLSHAHSQVIATPFVPRILKEEFEASRRFWMEKSECIFCKILKDESSGPRFIMANSDFAVFAPYASVHPMEFWIFPKRHKASMLDITETEVESFAKTLKECFLRLKILLNDPPYNFGIHTALNKKAKEHYHWHLEVYPKLAVWAGFEKSTGVYINTVSPENAAESLRTVITA